MCRFFIYFFLARVIIFQTKVTAFDSELNKCKIYNYGNFNTLMFIHTAYEP